MNDDSSSTPPPEAPRKKLSARELMALRQAAEAGDAEAQARLAEIKAASAAPAAAAPAVPSTPEAPAVQAEAPAAPVEAAAPATPSGEPPKKKISAREMMALRKAAEEGDAEAQATLAALKSAPAAVPAAVAPPAAPAGEPKKKVSAREMMALRKAAEEGDADAKAQLEALKSGAPAPAAAAPTVPATPAAPAPAAAPAAAPPRPAAPAAPPKPAAPPPPALTPAQEAEVQRFRDHFGDDIVSTGIAGDTPIISVTAARIREVAAFCRDSGYNFPDTITAVDLLDEGKLRVVYVLAGLPDIKRTVILHADLPREGVPRIPSVVSIYDGANWDEREVYDLFGIEFEGHPDLRRIMTPDDWEGHPLRKDYTFID